MERGGDTGEAKIINGKLTERALTGNQNVVFDEVAGNTEKIVTGNPEKGIESKVANLETSWVTRCTLSTWMHPCTKHHAYHGSGSRTTGRFVDPDYMLNEADDKPIITYKG